MAARALIVDDSALVIHELARIVTEELGFEVAGTAEHGLQAVDMATALRPDLVTLDVRMPVMNGLTALKHIMTRRPVATVMVSGATNEESHLAFECLRCGALDFVWKPSSELDGGDREVQRARIRDRLRGAAGRDAPAPRYCRLRRQAVSVRPSLRQPDSVGLIAAGRTGLAPLMAVVNLVPAGVASSWIVILDLAPRVVMSLAEYLARLTALSVQPAEPGMELRAETVCLMPAARPLRVRRERGVMRFDDQVSRGGARAVVESWYDACRGRRLLSALLSGAARDVAERLADLATSDVDVVAQSPPTALQAEGLRRAADAPAVRVVSPYEVAQIVRTELVRGLR